MFWLGIAAALGLSLSKESPWGNNHRAFLDWLANDFNWIAPILFLCVVPMIYLFRAADQIHSEYVAAAEATQLELSNKLEAYEKGDQAKFVVSFSKGISGCCASNHNGQLYYRLLVMLECHQAVSSCSGVLTCVERKSDGKILMNHESIPLPFTPSHEADSTNKTLVPARPYFLDLLIVHEKAQQLQNPGPGGEVYILKDNEDNPVFSKPDTYLLTVNLAGIGIKTQIEKACFEWTGDFKTVEYSMA